jgi:hypothetical protein
LFYGHSTSPYKPSRLNCEYKYLQLLLSQCIYPKYIFTCIYWEIKPREAIGYQREQIEKLVINSGKIVGKAVGSKDTVEANA